MRESHLGGPIGHLIAIHIHYKRLPDELPSYQHSFIYHLYEIESEHNLPRECLTFSTNELVWKLVRDEQLELREWINCFVHSNTYVYL